MIVQNMENVDGTCVCDEEYQGPDCSDNSLTCPVSVREMVNVSMACICFPMDSGRRLWHKCYKFCPNKCSAGDLS